MVDVLAIPDDPGPRRFLYAMFPADLTSLFRSSTFDPRSGSESDVDNRCLDRALLVMFRRCYSDGANCESVSSFIYVKVRSLTCRHVDFLDADIR